jgi:hypothetical protein
VAILTGTEVTVRALPTLVSPAPPLFGRISGIGGGTGRVDWANGLSSASVPVSELFMLVANPDGVEAFVQVGAAYKLKATEAQELLGVVTKIMTLETDAGEQLGAILLAMFGRGDQHPAYMLATLETVSGVGTAQQLFGNWAVFAARLAPARFPRF